MDRPSCSPASVLSPFDVVTAVANQNLPLPSGTAKVGQFEYDVDMNYSPKQIAELNDFPVKVAGNSTIYLRDVANVRNGFAPQTNIIRRETINIMTLGGLALAVGILVDDATVTIENIERFLQEGYELHHSILEGAAQIAVLVSTLCICIVFLPMFFLSGVAKYLFIPLAEAVVFAMIASYIFSRTLAPTLAMYLLRTEHEIRVLAIRWCSSNERSSAASNSYAPNTRRF